MICSGFRKQYSGTSFRWEKSFIWRFGSKRPRRVTGPLLCLRSKRPLWSRRLFEKRSFSASCENDRRTGHFLFGARGARWKRGHGQRALIHALFSPALRRAAVALPAVRKFSCRGALPFIRRAGGRGELSPARQLLCPSAGRRSYHRARRARRTACRPDRSGRASPPACPRSRCPRPR